MIRKFATRSGLNEQIELFLCILLILLLSACVSTKRWQRTFTQTCHAHSMPRICLNPTPDNFWTLHIRNIYLVPGECAELEHGSIQRGFVQVSLKDGHTNTLFRRTFWVQKSKEIHVHMGISGRIMVDQQICSKKQAKD